MSLVPWYAALALMHGALAIWVLLVQPRRLLNWTVGYLLLLWGGAGVVFQMMREAPDPVTFDLYSRIASYYFAPALILILLVAYLLARPASPSRAWQGIFLLAGLLVLATLANVVFASIGAQAEWAAGSAERPFLFFVNVPWFNASATILAEAAVAVVGGYVAADPRRSLLERRQAAMVGLAFALLVAHSGGTSIGFLFVWPRWPLILTSLASAVGLVAALYALKRLPVPFHDAQQIAIKGSILLALAFGILQSLKPVPIPGGGYRVLVVTAFAFVLAVAVLRYGLAERGVDRRHHVQTTAAIILGVSVTVVVAGAARSVHGTAPALFGGALLATLLPLALLATPLKAIPAWMTRHVLLHPHDPDAFQERVQVYASTLRAAVQEGRVPEETEPALAALRERLGISERDHEILLAMAAGAPFPPVANVSAGGDAPQALVGLARHAVDQTLFVGRYRIHRLLGRGSGGIVWLAHDTRLGRDVALKHLCKDEVRGKAAVKLMQREMRAASALQHPQIVAVYDAVVDAEETYIVMEYLPGGTLEDALRARRRLSEDEVVRMGLDILGALDALHAQAIVHRDVKPANILFDANGRAKLADFTLAHPVVSGDTLGNDGNGGPIGTFAYMPPEQARGFACRPQADLYALAATLYEAIAGRPVLHLDGLSQQEAVVRLSREMPPLPVPHASRRLSMTLARALSKAPGDRFADAAEMAAALEGRAVPLNHAGTREGFGRRPGRPPA